jgi:hypothetical protein
MVCFVSVGQERLTHLVSISNRLTSVGFIALAVLMSLVMAWALGLGGWHRRLGTRFGVSLAASLVGAAIIYGVIWRGLWPLFDA